jgi:cytochrome b561
MSGSSKKKYYTIAKIMHWIAGFFIAFNLLSGWQLGDFPLNQKVVLIMIHSGIGTTIFGLMLLRLWWRRKHKLYTPPGWWKRPSMILQWIFYPLVLIQAIIGVVQAAFIDYDVLAFGFIPYSALAAADERLHSLFLELHGLTAIVLILLVVCHGIERGRTAFMDDGKQMSARMEGG